MSESMIVGVDHGYAAMKTAHFSFPSGLVAYEHEPYTLKDVKKLKSSGRKYIISATTSTRLPAASMQELRSRRMPNGDSIFWIRYMSLCSG